MPVFSYVRAMAHYSVGHENEFTEIELDILHDHCDGLSKAQIVEKYKDVDEDPLNTFNRIEWKLNRLRHKETRQKMLSQK